MKVSIHNTSKVVTFVVDGVDVPARIWEGTTESGVPVHCFITRLAPTIPKDDPRQAEFERELREQEAPTSDVQSYPLRMIL